MKGGKVGKEDEGQRGRVGVQMRSQWLLSELSMQLTEVLYVIFIIYQRSEHLDKVDCSSGLHGTEDTLKVLPL